MRHEVTKGIWESAVGVTPVIPSQVFEIEPADDRAMTVYAPATAADRTAGNLFDTPLLTVRYSSPLPGDSRVQVTHFDGAAATPPAIHRC